VILFPGRNLCRQELFLFNGLFKILAPLFSLFFVLLLLGVGTPTLPLSEKANPLQQSVPVGWPLSLFFCPAERPGIVTLPPPPDPHLLPVGKDFPSFFLFFRFPSGVLTTTVLKSPFFQDRHVAAIPFPPPFHSCPRHTCPPPPFFLNVAP